MKDSNSSLPDDEEYFSSLPDDEEFLVIANIARFIISLAIIVLMTMEALNVTKHCDINIMLMGFILLWLGTFRPWN